MATLAELNEQVDALQAALDAEQAEIQAAIDALNGVIADLEVQVSEGGSAEDRQAVLDKIVAIKEDLEATVNPEVPEDGDEDDEEPVEDDPEAGI